MITNILLYTLLIICCLILVRVTFCICKGLGLAIRSVTIMRKYKKAWKSEEDDIDLDTHIKLLELIADTKRWGIDMTSDPEILVSTATANLELSLAYVLKAHTIRMLEDRGVPAKFAKLYKLNSKSADALELYAQKVVADFFEGLGATYENK